MLKMGYVVYTEPYRLNVVGVRSSEKTSLKFNDIIAFFYFDDNGNLRGKVCPATTDPSVDYLLNPLPEVSGKGTAILKSGQYVDTYKIDLHRGKYLALCQNLKPVTVIRDNDRNSILNFFAETNTGMFGINIHKASDKNDATIIGADSAGCQVFQNVSDFNEMMYIAKISSERYGNKFTYTLLDKIDTYKKVRDYSLLGLIFVVVGLGGYYMYKKYK